MKSIDPKGSAFTYEYSADGKRNLTKATSAENVVYNFEYDAYGNAKKAKVGDATLFMASDAAYTASGNYVQSVTDKSGNVVTYSYVVLGSNTSYRYVYDPTERLIKITGSEGSSLVYVVIVMPSNPYANARLK